MSAATTSAGPAGLVRRALPLWIALVIAATGSTRSAGAGDDPLPSWNDGAAKSAITKFLADTGVPDTKRKRLHALLLFTPSST